LCHRDHHYCDLKTRVRESLEVIICLI